jgi:RNA polymerase sigma-70 factor (ECF subfamily)
MSNLLDRYLLFRIRTKRDPEAYAKIYDRYVKALFRFAFLKLPSREEAQDITAECFTKTWVYLQEHPSVGNVRALLYRVSRNLIADYYRSRPEARGVGFVGGDGDSVTFGSDTTSYSVVPEEGRGEQGWGDKGRGRDMIEARAELSLILKKLESLKEDYRDVVTLRLVDGLAFEDIADILGKSRSNVRVIYHRAIKNLKD